jgi:RNA polymerase sigma-70 factor (ECF subfamily)
MKVGKEIYFLLHNYIVRQEKWNGFYFHSTFRGSVQFSSWIYRIAHNLTIDSYRKNKKEMENISIDDEEYASVVQSLSDGNSPQIDLHKKEIKACVQKALSLLSSEYREAIVLHCIE